MKSGHGTVTVIAPCLSRGGMTRAYFICQTLKQIGHEVELIGHLPAGESIYPEPPSNLTVVPVHGAFPAVVGAVARRINGDIAYAIKPLPTSLGAALRAKRRCNIRVIVDIDDHELLFRSHKTKRREGSMARNLVRSGLRSLRHLPQRLTSQHSRHYLRAMERQLADADAITSNTRTLQGNFGGTLLRSAIDTAHFDPSHFDDDDMRRTLGLENHFVVMFPGTAREHKGLEDVLQAMDILENKKTRLVIVGGRGVGVTYANELQNRWPQWVKILPPCGSEDMPQIISAAHVVVVTQRDVSIARAQFPIKLTDAMAMARPIITTHVGDIPEIVGDAAWVVSPSSPPDIASALEEIISNPDLARQRGAAARELCIETLSVESAAEILSRVLKDMNPR